eukprot:1160686-Pelagomonas_calceolata.AAC.6
MAFVASSAGTAFMVSDIKRLLSLTGDHGYETTANGLAFTMFLLGMNPDAEAKLVAEVGFWCGACKIIPACASK